MKKSVKLTIVFLAMYSIMACRKDSISVSCYECSTDIESIEVCEENGNFVVDGETIDNPNNASLEEFINAIEANPNNDAELEGIRCIKK